MKRQGQASNSSGLGRIAPCRIQIRQGATIVQSQEDDGAECQSWSNRANGKANEWAEKYADRIQQHLDAKEESFSIDADNQSFPPSISGIQNGIFATRSSRTEGCTDRS